MSDHIDIGSFNKKDINKFARKLSNTNTAIWDTIGYVEELLDDDIFKSFKQENDEEKRDKFIIEITKSFKNIKNRVDNLIDIQTYDRYFQDYYCKLAQEINKHLD